MQLKALIGENEEDDNPWFCKFCNKKVTEMSKVIGIIDKKMEIIIEDISDIKTDITDIKSELINKCDEVHVKQLIKEEISSSINIHQGLAINTHDNDLGTVVKEMEDRNSRKNNFLIFHAQEINSDLKNEVDKNNCNIANTILVNCNVGEKLDSHHVTRIGLKGQNPRPILVTLGSTENKRLLFKGFNGKIKNCNNDLINKVQINHDLTKLQKTEEKNLQTEAKELEMKEGKRYKVRGPPWARKIIEIMY